jgi:hypothetical protein
LKKQMLSKARKPINPTELIFMPTITLTLTDTPNGAVSIHSSWKPAVGNPCSPAQSAALEIIARTHKQWGVHIDAAPGGVDIDAVHRVRNAARG